MALMSINGIGAVTALGAGVDTLREALQGKRRPRIVEEAVETPHGPVSLPVYRAIPDGLETFMPRQTLRRMDRFSRCALLAVHLAFQSASIAPQTASSHRFGVIFGSAYGPLETLFQFQDTIMDDGDKCASPMAFAHSVHNALASTISIGMKWSGPCITISAFERTVAEVFYTARLWLESNTVDYVLVGVGEVYSPVLGYSLVRDADQWPTRIQPFCHDRCSYLPGEGCVAFVLGRDDTPPRFGYISEIQIIAESNIPCLMDRVAVFLAANGNIATGPVYQSMAGHDQMAIAHAPLIGSMPTQLAFEVAFAGLAMSDRMVHSITDVRSCGKACSSQSQVFHQGACISCVGAESVNDLTILTLKN